MTTLEKTLFCMDALEERMFEGYSDGSTWNGWACPYFVKEVAEAVLQASQKNGYRYKYDEGEKTFVVSHENDLGSPEMFEAVRKLTVDGELILYAVGAYSWIWERC